MDLAPEYVHHLCSRRVGSSKVTSIIAARMWAANGAL